MDSDQQSGGEVKPAPTEKELQEAFANLLVLERRDDAVDKIYRAMRKFAGLAHQFKSVELEFEEIVSIAAIRFLDTKRPIQSEAPYGLLKVTLTRLYLDEVRKNERRERLEKAIQSGLDDEFPSAQENEELEPIDERTILDDLVSQVLPGRCGKMKNVPNKVESMYHEFQEIGLSGKQAGFSGRKKKDHERIRKKVLEVVSHHVDDELERRRYFGFVKSYLRLRKKSDGTSQE